MKYFPTALEPVWRICRRGESEFGPGRPDRVAEDLLLGPVVELGGYEVPVADLGAPRDLALRQEA